MSSSNDSLNGVHAIKEILQQNRPDLSIGSLRTYSSIISNLAKQLNAKFDSPKEVCKNHKLILDHLKDVNPKLRKTRLSALVVFCDKENKEVADKFRDLMLDDGKKADDEMKDQKMNDKQRANMIPYEDVMGLYNKLEKEVAPLMKMDKLDKNQFHRVQMYVLLSCLLLIPVRRSLDFTEFKIKNIDKEKDNFMIVIKRKPYFVFNVYKTAKKYKQQQVEIPNKLKLIIDKWTKLNPSDYLLVNTRMTDKINPTQLTNLLYGFFNKPISTSILRHIYLSHVYKDVPSLIEMEERAENMGASVNEAFKTYVKKS
jgi:integrase